jgi:hypothetical protein
MQSIAQIQSEMLLLSQWANIPADDYVALFVPPTDPNKAIEHSNRANAVYDGSFQEALKVWNRLPLAQWETTKLLGRDLPEWIDLKESLIAFRRELRKIRRVPKKANNAETQSPEVPQ